MTYDWHWRQTSPLATGLDMIVVTWSGRDDTGRPLYILGDVPDAAAGVYPGVSADPSTGMAQAIEQGADGSWEWGIELSEQQFAPGQIQVRLVRAMVDAPPAAPGPVQIQASYIHQGVWREQMTYAVCSW